MSRFKSNSIPRHQSEKIVQTPITPTSVIHPAVTKNVRKSDPSKFVSEYVFQNNVKVKINSKKVLLSIRNPNKDQMYLLSGVLNRGDRIKNFEIQGNMSKVSEESLYVLVLKEPQGKSHTEITVNFNNVISFKVPNIFINKNGILALYAKNSSTDYGRITCTFDIESSL